MSTQRPFSTVTKTGLRRGLIAFLLMLWVWGWIGLGALTIPSGTFWGALQTLGFGVAGLASGGLIYVLLHRMPLQYTMIFVIAGSIPTCVVSVWMGATVPQMLTSLTLPANPQPLTFAQLDSRRPPLPAYVQMEGRLLPEMRLSQSYTVRDSTTKRTRTLYVAQAPLVPPAWQPGDPVRVVVHTDAYDYTNYATGEAVATGVLYPIAPRPGERPWVSAPFSVEFTPDWYRENAKFKFDPDQLYFLTDDTPGRLKFMFYLFTAFTTMFIAFVIKMALNSEDDPPAKPQLKKNRRQKKRISG